MAESSKDSKDTRASEATKDKKPPETVMLTAEELRAIAGGAKTPVAPPPTPGTTV